MKFLFVDAENIGLKEVEAISVIPDYVTGIEKITGSHNGYTTRKALLACVGHCWDLATAEVKIRSIAAKR